MRRYAGVIYIPDLNFVPSSKHHYRCLQTSTYNGKEAVHIYIINSYGFPRIHSVNIKLCLQCDKFRVQD